MIKFLKTHYWKIRLTICYKQYSKSLSELRSLKFLRYSNFEIYESNIDHTNRCHSYWKRQVALCNSQLSKLTS